MSMPNQQMGMPMMGANPVPAGQPAGGAPKKSLLAGLLNKTSMNAATTEFVPKGVVANTKE